MNGEWKERLHRKLGVMGATIEELFIPPFGWSEITTFLKAAIITAEEFYPDANQGVAKQELVMEIWEYYDKEYHLVDRLDQLIDFRKFLGTLVGTIVEQFDNMAIEAVIEQVMIPLIVGSLFPHFLRRK